jgi:hypothetical protein
VEATLALLPAHVIETEPGDLIVIDEHLFHASSGGAVRRQWRVDYLPVPAGAAFAQRMGNGTQKAHNGPQEAQKTNQSCAF